MASMGNERASSSSSFTPCWTYDVFLSFRGTGARSPELKVTKETGYHLGQQAGGGFTDHLYFALKQKGIFTFRDDEKLERGKSISPKLLKAIEESRFAIVILSRNYASSIWCLDELAKIIKCMKETGMTILPIFYKVDPSDVRKRTGTFAEAFVKHKKENKKKEQKWRATLREVANLSGWHLQDG
ncbi:toll/interleukin-1 receptor-like protein [Quercus lobata]|uniref:toll/interleukin-1 receptor-like protein n=1 Tax=Quercus lobata TaxID=97700 RepID=UPI001248E36C|nr:toll/interleukin-1 receptor-like protein [Quercus lobata]